MYTFTDTEGIMSTVDLEAWSWGVIYKDGGELKQFGDDMKFHQFREIDWERGVSFFLMFNTADQSKHVNIVVQPNMQIFHFYQWNIWNAGTPDEARTKLYVFGWKDRETGSTVHHYILPDGRLLVSGERLKDIPGVFPDVTGE